MKKYRSAFEKSALFHGIQLSDLEPMLTCLSATHREYKKGEYIIQLREPISSVGLVLTGRVHIIKEDVWGNRSILSELSEGMLFGEAYACSQSTGSAVSVIATQKSELMFLNIRKMLTVCSSACLFHTRLIQNLITVLADKNRILTEKIEHMSQRTTREKLLSYLSQQAQKHANLSFDIPFNRQQLADFLCVDRSAMSNALSKLREEGVLMFEKNHFQLFSLSDHFLNPSENGGLL